MPLELTNWEDFRRATTDSSTFVYRKEDGKCIVSTTQFYIVTDWVKDVQEFVKERNALAVGKGKRWDDLFT